MDGLWLPVERRRSLKRRRHWPMFLFQWEHLRYQQNLKFRAPCNRTCPWCRSLVRRCPNQWFVYRNQSRRSSTQRHLQFWILAHCAALCLDVLIVSSECALHREPFDWTSSVLPPVTVPFYREWNRPKFHHTVPAPDTCFVDPYDINLKYLMKWKLPEITFVKVIDKSENISMIKSAHDGLLLSTLLIFGTSSQLHSLDGHWSSLKDSSVNNAQQSATQLVFFGELRYLSCCLLKLT